MKKVIYLLLVFMILTSFKTNEAAPASLSFFWSTNSIVKKTPIVVTPLKGNQIFTISSLPLNESDETGTITVKGKTPVKFNEGGGAILNINAETIIDYYNVLWGDNFNSRGTVKIEDFQKALVSKARFALNNKANVTSAVIMDTDYEFFFMVNITGGTIACPNTVINVKVDGNMVDIDNDGNADQFTISSGFVGYGKRVELILSQASCSGIKYVDGTIGIYQ